MLLICSPRSFYNRGSETATLQIKSLDNQGSPGLSAALPWLLQVVLSSPRRLGAQLRGWHFSFGLSAAAVCCCAYGSAPLAALAIAV